MPKLEVVNPSARGQPSREVAASRAGAAEQVAMVGWFRVEGRCIVASKMKQSRSSVGEQVCFVDCAIA